MPVNRRVLSAVVAGLLLVGVVVAVVASRGGSPSGGGGQSGPLTTVRGVIGSEKLPFFQDAAVQAAFRRNGLTVHVDTAGSREIATTTNLSRYDFAFPAGAPQADKIKADHHAAATYVPFFTPMAIATFTPIVDILTANGVARKQGDLVLFDVKAYLDLVKRNARWTDLKANSTYPASKSVLVTSTDVRTSNSAAMYLALASYVANGNNIVADTGQADAGVQGVAPLFLRQGFLASSSQEPFQDYLSIGIGKTPMVMVYEAQFRAEQLAGNAALGPQMQLMYPTPTVFSKHTLVPLNGNGDTVGRLLTTDPELQHLAVQYGFRTQDTAYARSLAQKRGIPALPDLVDVIDPPTFDVLERMINGIAALYQQTASGRPAATETPTP
jgi:hypothetical protein